jgi:hypothetical protein
MSGHAERLTEFGIPVDALAGFLGEQIAAVKAVEMSPQGRWLQQNEAGLRGYLEQHPDVAGTFGRMAQADTLGAVEYLAMRVERDRGGQPVRDTIPVVHQDPSGLRVAVHSVDADRTAKQDYIRRRLGSVIDEDWLRQ